MSEILSLSELASGQAVTLWKIGEGVITACGTITQINDAEHTVKFIEDTGRETEFRLTSPYFWLMLFEDSVSGARCYSERGPFYVFRTPS